MDDLRTETAVAASSAGIPTPSRPACARLLTSLARMAAWCQTWVAARHPAIVAVLLALIVWMLRDFDLLYLKRLGERPYDFLFWGAIFSVGAVQRSNWRHVLPMALLGGVSCAAAEFIPSVRDSRNWNIFIAVAFRACMILSVALCESFVTSRRLCRGIAWLVALAAAAGAIHVLAHDFLRHCRGAFIPTGLTSGEWYSPGSLYWPLLAALTWVVIPLSAAYAPPISSRRAAWTLCGLGLSVAGLVIYEQFVIFTIARWSMEKGLPFLRSDAGSLLEYRGRPTDFECLWRALEKDDWRRWIEPYAWRDWRENCVAILARHDRDATAARLSDLLRTRPRRQLASISRDLLIECRRLECVPLLFRYVLVDSLESGGSWKAFQRLGIPETAKLIFLDVLHTAAMKKRTTWPKLGTNSGKWDWVKPDGIYVPADVREALVGIFGEDAGDDLLSWMELYDERIDTLDSPLSAAQRQEVRRTCECFEDYVRVYGAWQDVRKKREWLYALEQMQANFPDDYAEMQRLWGSDALERWKAVLDDQSQATAASLKMQQYADEAHWKLAIDEPDWDVPSVDELEQEVREYVSRVRAKLEDGPREGLPDPNVSQ